MNNDKQDIQSTQSETSRPTQEPKLPITTESQQEVPKKDRKTPTITMYALALILLFVFGAYGLWFYQKNTVNKQVTSIPSPSTSPHEPLPTTHTTSDLPAGAKILENGWYIIFNDSVYYGEISNGSLVIGADASTFEHIELINGGFSGFFKDKNYVYYALDGEGKNRIENSDSSSFHFLSRTFAKDKNQAYFEAWTMGGSILYVLDQVDTATFTLVNDWSVAKDINNVYYAHWDGVQIIKDADPNTIMDLGFPFTKDKNAVFYHNYSIKDINLDAVQLLGGSYLKDDSNVYYCEGFKVFSCLVTENADPESFQLIQDGENMYANGFVAKDKFFLYSRGVAVENSDPATFEIVENSTAGQKYNARDKNNLYDMWCDMDGCRLEIVQEN